MTTYFWTCLLCSRNDACGGKSIRYGPFWYNFSRLSSALRLNYCCRNFNKQNGSDTSSFIWADARPQMNSFYGQLRKRRRLLPLLIFSGARLWPNYSCWYICSRMPPFSRGVTIWFNTITGENRVCFIRIKFFIWMIRRWSYINGINFIPKPIIFKLKKKIKLKLFKKHVKFRKFKKLKLKFFKFRRKAFRRLKHHTNFLPLANSFKCWATDYKTIRASLRFEYVFNIFSTSYLIANAAFIKTITENDDTGHSFLFNTFTHKLNRAILPINTSYISLEKWKFFYIFKNSAAGLAWLDEDVWDLENKKTLKLLYHSDFFLFNVSTGNQTKENTKLSLNNLFFMFTTDFLFFYKIIFTMYLKFLINKS